MSLEKYEIAICVQSVVLIISGPSVDMCCFIAPTRHNHYHHHQQQTTCNTCCFYFHQLTNTTAIIDGYSFKSFLVSFSFSVKNMGPSLSIWPEVITRWVHGFIALSSVGTCSQSTVCVHHLRWNVTIAAAVNESVVRRTGRKACALWLTSRKPCLIPLNRRPSCGYPRSYSRRITGGLDCVPKHALYAYFSWYSTCFKSCHWELMNTMTTYCTDAPREFVFMEKQEVPNKTTSKARTRGAAAAF